VKVNLRRRHYGIHEMVRDCDLPGVFADYATTKPGSTDPDDCAVDEAKLLGALPEGFLPLSPRRILLTVEDENGGTGQTGLTAFRDWAKYFDAYVVSLVKDEVVTEAAG
jgi:hypothetical protein